MITMKKSIILGVVIFLLVAVTAGIIYLNNVYLPVKVKDQLVKAIETNLRLNAEIEKIRFNIIKGLSIQNISLYDKTRENPILTVKEVHFNFLLLPLFKERKIIIPVIYVESPEMLIRYKSDNTFNFSKIFPLAFKTQAPKRNGFSLLVLKINFLDAKCAFEDEHFSPVFRKSLEDARLSIGINPFADVSFSLKAKLILNEKAHAKLSLQGGYDIRGKEAKAKVELGNLLIPEFGPYLQKLPVDITSGNIETADFQLKFKDWIITAKGKAGLKRLTLKKDNLTFSADTDLEPDLSYSLIKKELDYKSGIKLIGAGLEGIALTGKISNISGDLNLAKDKISTDDLKFQALDSAFTLKGGLENFSAPYLKTNISSEQLNLEKLFTLLPHPAGLKLTGTSKAQAAVEGLLSKMPLDIKASFDVTQAQAQGLPLVKEPLNNIRGKINLTLDTAGWEALSFNYRNTDYSSDGKITDFQQPRIKFSLASKSLDLKSDLEIKDNSIALNTVDAKYLDSKFYLKGNINTQDKDNPLLDLDTKLNINIPDLLPLLPQNTKAALDKIKPEGKLDITAALSGNIKDYKNLSLRLKGSSDALSAYNLKFTDLYFTMQKTGPVLELPSVSAAAYSGAIRMQGNFDLGPDIPAYFLKLNAADIDLAKLKTDLNLKEKDLAGIMDIEANFSGDFKGVDNLKGAAGLSIENGKLWEVNLLKGLGELIFLPDYQKIAFNQAHGTFDIENKSMITDDLQLISDQLKLNINGKVGFDGTLGLTIYNEVNKGLIKDSSDIRKLFTAILGEVGGSIVVKVSGTVQKPKYSIVPVVSDVIKGLKDFILGK